MPLANKVHQYKAVKLLTGFRGEERPLIWNTVKASTISHSNAGDVLGVHFRTLKPVWYHRRIPGTDALPTPTNAKPLRVRVVEPPQSRTLATLISRIVDVCCVGLVGSPAIRALRDSGVPMQKPFDTARKSEFRAVKASDGLRAVGDCCRGGRGAADAKFPFEQQDASRTLQNT
jgi:hypothetical protein